MTSALFPREQKTPVWLDVDTGHDDVFAVLIAAHHPTLELLGVSTAFGNADLANTTSNTSSILTALKRTDVSVYPGASKPFCRDDIIVAEIHGSTGLSGTSLIPPPNAPIVKDVNAIVAARDALMSQPPKTAWVVATGPLTNMGLLFATFPEVASHIAGLSIMGGAVGEGFTEEVLYGKTLAEGKEGFGNETPWAEFNIYCDPEAARSIFSNPVLAAKTTLITLDLTHQCLATKAIRQSLLYGEASHLSTTPLPSPLRKLLNEILEFFAESYDEFFDIKAGPPLHDPLAAAVIFGYDTNIYEEDGERYRVTMVTNGEHSALVAEQGQIGRTIVTRMEKDNDGLSHGVRIPRKLNVDVFWRMLEECCRIADASSAQ